MENGGLFLCQNFQVFEKTDKICFLSLPKKSALPLLTRLSDTDSISEIGQKMLRHDILASNLYQSVITDKYKTAFRNEYKTANAEDIRKGDYIMKRPFTRLEKKQLLIFALIAFGIPYLMGIPMAFGYQRGTSLDFLQMPRCIIRLPEPLSSFF